jgi:glyoxylase-like metal-dependent hydrolase (beta-lactamase superfamily II)
MAQSTEQDRSHAMPAGFERDTADGVHRVTTGPVNWYLVEDDAGVTAVDAGLPRSWEQLGWALAALGRRPNELRAVILTHAHFDHVGFAERARRELAVPVMVHPDDEPLSRHPLRYKTEKSPLAYLWRPASLGLFAQMTRAGAPWTSAIGAVQTFADGDELDVPGRPRVVATPGHTFGHVSFHLPQRDVLLAGDAVVTLDPYTARSGPRVVARAATADAGQALASLDRVEATGAGVVLCGHGEPWRGGAAAIARQARAAGSA